MQGSPESLFPVATGEQLDCLTSFVLVFAMAPSCPHVKPKTDFASFALTDLTAFLSSGVLPYILLLVPNVLPPGLCLLDSCPNSQTQCPAVTIAGLSSLAQEPSLGRLIYETSNWVCPLTRGQSLLSQACVLGHLSLGATRPSSRRGPLHLESSTWCFP